MYVQTCKKNCDYSVGRHNSEIELELDVIFYYLLKYTIKIYYYTLLLVQIFLCLFNFQIEQINVINHNN